MSRALLSIMAKEGKLPCPVKISTKRTADARQGKSMGYYMNRRKGG